ncbi:hypothetical protein BH10CHL1_BH10CHL1_35460 [soil metagenome]
MSHAFLRSVLLIILLCSLLNTLGTPVALASQPNAPHVVIGVGTAASCQTQAAANALSTAVAGGGEISFNCGVAPVTLMVNTNATDQIVTIDGGGLVTLSGDNVRQIFLVFGSGKLTLNNLTLLDGANFGGAAVAVSTAQASATINNTFLTSNDAGANNGGAIANVGLLTITNSTLGANSSTGFGGAIFNNGGTVTISNTTIINNEAREGGGIWHSEGTVNIANSAIRSNRSSQAGGGLHIDTGIVTVVNSTFYDNRANGGGGAIYMRGNSLTITNATFMHNRADTAGALWNDAGATHVKNTIFNDSRTADESALSLNCDGPAVISDGRNIVSDMSCVPNPSNVGDLLGVDPKLEPFINANGGPTRTFMLLADSPAIDYARNCPATDQRGVQRPVGADCDTGAVERAFGLYLPVVIRN